MDESEKNQGKFVIKITLICLAGLVLVLAVFSVGIMVGFRKARFSYQWGENYHKNFGGPPIGMKGPGKPQHDFLKGIRGDEFINPNGLSGSVIKFDTSTLYIKGDDGVEKSVAISGGTLIRCGRNTIKFSDLKTDDKVVILGTPSSSGQIEAKLIRVFSK